MFFSYPERKTYEFKPLWRYQPSLQTIIDEIEDLKGRRSGTEEYERGYARGLRDSKEIITKYTNQ